MQPIFQDLQTNGMSDVKNKNKTRNTSWSCTEILWQSVKSSSSSAISDLSRSFLSVKRCDLYDKDVTYKLAAQLNVECRAQNTVNCIEFAQFLSVRL